MSPITSTKLKTFVTIRRVDDDTIEYDVVEGRAYTCFANDADTLWRADDQEMIEAFREKYPDADINL